MFSVYDYIEDKITDKIFFIFSCELNELDKINKH